MTDTRQADGVLLRAIFVAAQEWFYLKMMEEFTDVPYNIMEQREDDLMRAVGAWHEAAGDDYELRAFRLPPSASPPSAS